MKKFILVAIIAISHGVNAQAQSATISKQNADAISSYDGISGRFEYTLSSTERLNVNYALTPKKPSTVARLMLHTPDPMPLSAKIMDASGKTVLTWIPTTKVYLYEASLNLASLSSGTYTLHLYMGSDPNSIYHFSFDKQ